jgi:hypothetical protein
LKIIPPMPEAELQIPMKKPTLLLNQRLIIVGKLRYSRNDRVTPITLPAI